MDPLCDVVSCCEPCVTQFEDVMNCIVNNVVDATIQDCTLTCDDNGDDDTSNRQLYTSSSSSSSLSRWLQENDMDNSGTSTEIANTCLETSPGLTGDSVEELAFRSPIFVGCMVGEFTNIVTEYDNHDNISPPLEPTTSTTNPPSTAATPTTATINDDTDLAERNKYMISTVMTLTFVFATVMMW